MGRIVNASIANSAVVMLYVSVILPSAVCYCKKEKGQRLLRQPL